MIYLLNSSEIDDAISLDLLDIEYIKQDINFLDYDYIIFTSKNAPLAIDSFSSNWKKIPSFCISNPTANKVNELGGNVFYVGKAKTGNEFANEISSYLQNKKVLYLSALKVVSSLVEILHQNSVDIKQIPIYKTSCKKPTKTLDDNAVVIFSSPSTIKCFLKYYKWENSYKAVAIGKTTASFIPSNINYVIAPKPTLQSAINVAKEI